MLKKFTVSNYRSFEKPITIDFTKVGDYDFNEECIKDGLINKAVIYGENAVGKTNFSKAILDVTTMIPGLTSNIVLNSVQSKLVGFLNAESEKEFAKFEYTFQIDGYEIEYIYEKSDINNIQFESLKIDQELFYELDFSTNLGNFDAFQKHPELAHLNLDVWDNKISVLKYILSHVKLQELTILRDFQLFIGGMMTVQALIETHNTYYQARSSISLVIIENNLVKDFEMFLKDANINVNLKVEATLTGEEELYFDYGNKLLPFLDHASSGTLSLTFLFATLHLLIKPTFLFIDEFDANFHFGVAKLMLEKFKKNQNCQTIITTHNTDLMSNKYMRPDCYLLMTPNKITNLEDATSRILRMGHNLENLYQAGEFNEMINRSGDKDE